MQSLLKQGLRQPFSRTFSHSTKHTPVHKPSSSTQNAIKSTQKLANQPSASFKQKTSHDKPICNLGRLLLNYTLGRGRY